MLARPYVCVRLKPVLLGIYSLVFFQNLVPRYLVGIKKKLVRTRIVGKFYFAQKLGKLGPKTAKDGAFCIIWPLHSQCTPSLPTEKPYGFLMFSGGREGCIGNEWVKRFCP